MQDFGTVCHFLPGCPRIYRRLPCGPASGTDFYNAEPGQLQRVTGLFLKKLEVRRQKRYTYYG